MLPPSLHADIPEQSALPPIPLLASGDITSENGYRLARYPSDPSSSDFFSFQQNDFDASCRESSILDLDTQDPQLLQCPDAELSVLAYAWSPSGTTLATAEGRHTDAIYYPEVKRISLYDAGTGKLLRSLPSEFSLDLWSISTDEANLTNGILWSPDGNSILNFKATRWEPCLLNPETLANRCLGHDETQGGYQYRFSPDGQSLIYASATPHGFAVCVYDIKHRTVSCPIQAGPELADREVVALKISPDGKHVALVHDQVAATADSSYDPRALVYALDGQLLHDLGRIDELTINAWDLLLWAPK
jgi:Tol biopolymer transport system component